MMRKIGCKLITISGSLLLLNFMIANAFSAYLNAVKPGKNYSLEYFLNSGIIFVITLTLFIGIGFVIVSFKDKKNN